MIFVLRAIMVSLAFFAILYSFLSLLVVLTWHGLRLCHFQKHIAARGLFTLRVIPFGISAAVSLFLTLPSFLLLEGHSLDEDFGTFVLSACAMVIIGAGIHRVLAAEARTRRVVSACLKGAIGLGTPYSCSCNHFDREHYPAYAGRHSGTANSDFGVSLQSAERRRTTGSGASREGALSVSRQSKKSNPQLSSLPRHGKPGRSVARSVRIGG